MHGNGKCKYSNFLGTEIQNYNTMNKELEYQKTTGLPSRKRNTGNLHSYTTEYLKWLEQQKKLLNLHGVSNSVCECGHYGIERVKYCSKCGKEVVLKKQTDC